METLKPDKVVALGRIAQTECNVWDIKAGVVPHPQFARRFINRERAGYARLLLEAAKSGKDKCRWRG